MNQNSKSAFKGIVPYLILGVGTLLLLFPLLFTDLNDMIKSILSNLGSFIVVTLALSWLWDIYGKKLYLDYILDRFNISKNIEYSGVIDFPKDFINDIDWKSIISSTNRISIFIIKGHTLRKTILPIIKETLSYRKIDVTVILPDINNSQLIDILAHKLETDSIHIKNEIEDSRKDFAELAIEKRCKLNIYYTNVRPMYAFYIFQNESIITLYQNVHKSTSSCITIRSNNNGFLYNTLKDEYDNILMDSKLVFPIS